MSSETASRIYFLLALAEVEMALISAEMASLRWRWR
jgi:hypothetical protein